MTTRIRYTKVGNRLISSEFVNYIGKRYQVDIHPAKSDPSKYSMAILQGKDVIHLHLGIRSLAEAKRIARRTLTNVFDVRLNNEIRPR